MKLLFATHNQSKYHELKHAFLQVLPAENWVLTPLSKDYTVPDETGKTFVENALIKAQAASAVFEGAVLADDSGLVVPALQGQPGIHSARYAHEHASDAENIAALLHAMRGLRGEERQAYFYCLSVFVRFPQDPCPLIAEGRLDGYILEDSRGFSGFGYDPVFYVPSQRKTVAELTLVEKNSLSHRAVALAALMPKLHDWLQTDRIFHKA